MLIDHFEKDLRPFYSKIDNEITLKLSERQAGLEARPKKDLAGIKKEINSRLAEKGLVRPNEDYIGRLKVQNIP